jgi:hypothetical protein
MGIKTYGEDPFVSIGLKGHMESTSLQKVQPDIYFVKILPVFFPEFIDSCLTNPVVSTGEPGYPPHYFVWRF